MRTTLVGPAVVGDRVETVRLEVADGRIASVDPVAGSEGAREAGGDVLGPGEVLVPGFVDLHCHGGGGTAFTDLDEDAAAAAARHHHAQGTTTLLASLVTASAADLERGVSILADLADDGYVAGIHLEGPWLSAARCGAHDPALLRDADRREVDRLLDLGRGHVRQVTLAPERARGLDLVRWLVDAGVHAAVGHTAATYEQVEEALAAGADLATHLFNAMDPWDHRAPGPVPALLRAAARRAAVVELVADGVHLADGTVRTVLDLVGAGSVAFVSDAIAAAGVGDGTYVLGGLPVTVAAGTARLVGRSPGERGPIAGGTSHLADAVARAVGRGLPLPAAVRAGATTPARLLGLDDRGRLAVGARADVVVLGPRADVRRVMRDGRSLGG